jgi:putative Mg2+ transporter-C (MgtC) family protein
MHPMNMPLHPGLTEIALRLVLTMAASAVIGFNRGARGHAAGLRTTILVGLAAAAAMIQANILLPLGGKMTDSFAVMDLMRLPLGILTGVGFIGGGAILRRGDLITGVTTAATLWMVTVIGLCFGGGQLLLAIAATLLSVITLWALKWFDLRIPREHRAVLVISAEDRPASAAALTALLAPAGFAALSRRMDRAGEGGNAEFHFEISWRRPDIAGPPLDLLERVAARYAVVSFELTSEARH